jgi:hypothetical protein
MTLDLEPESGPSEQMAALRNGLSLQIWNFDLIALDRKPHSCETTQKSRHHEDAREEKSSNPTHQPLLHHSGPINPVFTLGYSESLAYGFSLFKARSGRKQAEIGHLRTKLLNPR